MTAAYWDDEPRDCHVNGCNIWVTDDLPCNCADLTTIRPQRLTTAERLDRLHIVPEQRVAS
jgi:hypothetical protein